MRFHFYFFKYKSSTSCLAPTSVHSTASMVGVSSLASQESSAIGGIGLGDRAFPPQPGLSYSTWICVDKFSDPRTDPHPVRLLTIARTAHIAFCLLQLRILRAYLVSHLNLILDLLRLLLSFD